MQSDDRVADKSEQGQRSKWVQVWAPERNIPCTGCGVEFPALTFPIYIGHRKRKPDHGEVEFHVCPRCLRLLAEQTRDALAEFQRGIEP